MRRFVCLVLAVASAFAAVAATAEGSAPPPRLGKILGIVPSRLAGLPVLGNLQNLQDHGGPTMTTNTTYAIYWVPPGYTVSSGYRPLVDRFLGDVAADSGKTSNVYWSDTQYSGIRYASSFGGSVVDTSALPASGCVDADTAVCLSDAQIQAEVQKVVAAQGWKPSPTTLFFLFTAKGIGSCADATTCAFTQYCAYHSWIGSGSNVTLYANQPYADTVPSACDAGQRPNGDDADATINVASHEHNEAITDEQGNAWYDLQGNENGDKCAWDFGTQLGSTASGQYNQLIAGHPYELQQEWSNASGGCVLTGT